MDSSRSSGRSQRHTMVLEELIAWWQELTRQAIGSQAVLLAVPPQWGRTTLLDQFVTVVEEDEAVSIVVVVRGASLPDGLGLQAQKLPDLFRAAHVNHRVAKLLGVDRLGGLFQLSLGVSGLFVSLRAAGVALLLAEVGTEAVGRVWDNTPTGQEGTIARLARAVAAVSVSVPVVVILDDADRLDPNLAVTLVENLIERDDGRALVVAAADPDSNVVSTLIARAKYGPTEGKVLTAEADPSMDYRSRVALAAEFCHRLPVIATRRIGQRVATFADVFAVASAERLTELDPSSEDKAILAVVDQVINARPAQAEPSPEAVVLAWAGGRRRTCRGPGPRRS